MNFNQNYEVLEQITYITILNLDQTKAVVAILKLDDNPRHTIVDHIRPFLIYT
jgi:hypothetical protein